MWLHGSAVSGGLQRDSDVDLVALTSVPLDDVQRARLVRDLLHESAPPSASTRRRPIELTVVVAGDVVPWRYPPICDLLFGEWLRSGFEAGAMPRRHEEPDLAIALTLARQHGVGVVGPEPAAVLEEVPWRDLRAAMITGIPALLGDLDGDERNVLLTLARIAYTLESGRIAPKGIAGRWAAAALDPTAEAVVVECSDAYEGLIAESWDGRHTDAEQAAASLVALIEGRLAATTDGPAAR